MGDDCMDALFSTLMNEVNNLKSKKMQNIEAKAGTPEEVIERLTSMKSYSAFQVLQVSPEASEGEIAKQYRKLSVLIHPDKCSLEKASEAFQLLLKAYNDTKDPSYKDKYKDVAGIARERVRKFREKENTARELRGEDPLDLEGRDFDQEVLNECERMTTETTEKATYSNKVLEANMKRNEAQAREAKLARRQEDDDRKKWEKTRDKRVAGWQVFVQNVETKKFKSESWSKVGQVGAADVHHRREGRKETDAKPVGEGIPVGIDRTYKKAWR